MFKKKPYLHLYFYLLKTFVVFLGFNLRQVLLLLMFGLFSESLRTKQQQQQQQKRKKQTQLILHFIQAKAIQQQTTTLSQYFKAYIFYYFKIEFHSKFF